MLAELNFDGAAPLNLPVLRIVILVQERGHMWKRIRLRGKAVVLWVVMNMTIGSLLY